MGAAIDAVPKTVRAITSNPSLVLSAVVAGIGTLVLGMLAMLIPVIGPFVTVVFVAPLFVGGFLAMVNAGMDGRATLSDFIDGMSENYTSLAGGYAIVMVLMLVAMTGFAALLAATIGIGSLIGSGSPGEPMATDAFAALSLTSMGLFAVGVLLVLLFGLLVQFFDVAIVVGDESAISSFGESLSLVTSAPLSVVGYSILRGVLTMIVVYVPLGIAVAASTAIDGVPGMVLVAITYMIVLPLAYVVSYGYHVAYFRERRPETSPTPVA